MLNEDDFEALRRLAPQTLRDWPPCDREDLVQEAALRLHRLTLTEPHRRFETGYLCMVLRSVAIDEIRRRARYRRCVTSRNAALELDGVLLQPTPEQQLVARRLWNRVDECLQRLRASRRLLVQLRLHGESVREAAEHLGMRAKQAENHTYRGLNELRSVLLRHERE